MTEIEEQNALDTLGPCGFEDVSIIELDMYSFQSGDDKSHEPHERIRYIGMRLRHPWPTVKAPRSDESCHVKTAGIHGGKNAHQVSRRRGLA